MADAEQRYDMNAAAELKYGRIPDAEKALADEEARPPRTTRRATACCGR